MVVIAVVIGSIFLIILIISFVINAKKTGKWCFAPEEGEPEHKTSKARGREKGVGGRRGRGIGEEGTPLNSFEPQDVVDRLEYAGADRENGVDKNGAKQRRREVRTIPNHIFLDR